MSEVKRYNTALLGADIPVSVVDVRDYVALEAARDQYRDLSIKYGDKLSEVLKERDAALAELAALKGGQVPVAEVSAETFSSDGTSDIITRNLPIGTKLYTAAPVRSGAAVAVWDDMTKRALACTNQPIPHGADLYLAPSAQASAWVPEGWKPVPVEPTEAMMQAMVDPFIAISGDNRAAFISAYRTMLAAAPTPGAIDGKGDRP